jgi:hypothetical protein
VATVKVLYWHGIPTQVRAEDAEGRAGVQLADRFQLAIDEAAMAANLIGDDDYTNGFEWGDEEEREGEAQAVAEAVAAEIEQKHPTVEWQGVARELKEARRQQKGRS